MSSVLLCTPLLVEYAALRRAAPSLRLVRTGMGPRRAAATACSLTDGAPVLVAGVGGGLVPQVRPGDVVVASEVRPDGPGSTAYASGPGSAAYVGVVEVPSAPLLAGALRRLGLTVHIGPISSVSRIAGTPAAAGSLAVDMESAHLATGDVPFAVVRAIVDTTDHPLWRLGTLRRGVWALRALRACLPALHWWAAATGPREVVLAEPPAIVGRVDLMLVAGSADSANSLRLVEIAERQGVPAYLIDDISKIDLRWLAGTTRLSITTDSSAPPHLVAQIVHCLSGLGPVRRMG